MTNEDVIMMVKMMNADNIIDHEEITDEDFLHIVEKWIDVVQSTGLCGGLEHFTLIECKKALEKQIPKKPKNLMANTMGYCHNCDLYMIRYENPRCCASCGQAILWEDDNENDNM